MQKQPVPLIMGLVVGSLAGIAGTLVMDLVLMGGFQMMGLPAITCFSMVGDTVGRFLRLLGLASTGSPLTGVVAHYIIGSLAGAGFGAVLRRAAAGRPLSRKKGILLGLIYVELVSQPILASAPLLKAMSASELWIWFGGGLVMHALLGVVMGAAAVWMLQKRGTPVNLTAPKTANAFAKGK